MQTKKGERAVIAALLLLQTLIYILCGGLKSYMHMDEAYSLGLASYDKVEIQQNDDFYNNWHEGEYFEDYISLQEDEFGEYKQVYENQKNDVHPPFYYLILRFAMGFASGGYTKWPGVIINILCYGCITLLSYALLKRMLKDEELFKEKSALFAFLASITMASLANVMYIRMYALTTLLVLLVTYLHAKLRECDGDKAKWLVLVGVTALLGSLTHYYFLFYLFALFLYQAHRYIKEQSFKTLLWYFVCIAVAAALSLAIFPYSIEHMFFGYQGEGFISRLFSGPQFATNILCYLWIINENCFNSGLIMIVVAAVVLCCYLKKYRKDVQPIEEQSQEKRTLLNSMLIPTVFYFILVSVASPWQELRYVAAICVTSFLLVFYYFHRLLKSIWKQRAADRIIAFLLAVVFLVLPLALRQEPQAMYHQERADIVKTVEEKSDASALYVFNMNDNRFLDDILLFSKLNRSYISLDGENTAEYYASILKDTDLSHGLFLFINNGQDNWGILKTVQESMGFESAEWIERLNACDVYYLK